MVAECCDVPITSSRHTALVRIWLTKSTTITTAFLDKLVAVRLRQSWLDVLGDMGNVARKIVQGRSYRGLYEVLGYEATL
jgi:hypothetical protein